tara:strand:+ start:1961 stop:2326 length:366 start_codon:yes stop_codon:yes gene_type:complete
MFPFFVGRRYTLPPGGITQPRTATLSMARMCLPFPRLLAAAPLLELLELPDDDLLELLVLAFLECLFFPCVTPCARRRFCEAAALLLLLLLPSPGSHSESLMFIFKKNIRPKGQFFFQIYK